eukprot:SAG22_NODE_293_length_12891_cov_17.337242_3_plen_702_part_00
MAEVAEVAGITGCSPEAAEALLLAHGWDVPAAVTAFLDDPGRAAGGGLGAASTSSASAATFKWEVQSRGGGWVGFPMEALQRLEREQGTPGHLRAGVAVRALDGEEYRVDVTNMVARKSAGPRGRPAAVPLRRVAVSLQQSVGYTAVSARPERLDVVSNDQLSWYPETERSAHTIDRGDRLVLPSRFLQASLDAQDRQHTQERPCYRLVHRDQLSGEERVAYGGVLSYFPQSTFDGSSSCALPAWMKEHLGLWTERSVVQAEQVRLPPARHVELQPVTEDFEEMMDRANGVGHLPITQRRHDNLEATLQEPLELFFLTLMRGTVIDLTCNGQPFKFRVAGVLPTTNRLVDVHEEPVTEAVNIRPGFHNELSLAMVKSAERQAKVQQARQAEAALAKEARQYESEVGHRTKARLMFGLRIRCPGISEPAAATLLANHAYDIGAAADAWRKAPGASVAAAAAAAATATEHNAPAQALEPEPEAEPGADAPPHADEALSMDNLRRQRAAFFAQQQRPVTLMTLATSGSSDHGGESQTEAADGQLANSLSQSLSRIRSAAAAAGTAASAHIKVQLPDGATINQRFAANDEMEEVYSWLRGHPAVAQQDVDPARLVLHETVLARRELHPSAQRLVDLGLCPGARLSAIETMMEAAATGAVLSRQVSAPRGTPVTVTVVGLVGGKKLPPLLVAAGAAIPEPCVSCLA